MELSNAFLNEFKDFRVSDIKSLFKLEDDKDEELESYFNAINNDVMNDNVNERFVNNFVLDNNNNIEHTVLLIKYIYGPIINGRVLHDIMENFLNTKQTKSNNSLVDFEDLKQYQEMIYCYFNRYQINLDDKEDKELFTKMLSNSEECIKYQKAQLNSKLKQVTSRNLSKIENMSQNSNTFLPTETHGVSNKPNW